MNEQTLAFVLKLRMLYQSTQEDSVPLLRGSLVHVASGQEQYFHSLEQLIEILTHSLNTAARDSKTEQPIAHPGASMDNPPELAK